VASRKNDTIFRELGWGLSLDWDWNDGGFLNFRALFKLPKFSFHNCQNWISRAFSDTLIQLYSLKILKVLAKTQKSMIICRILVIFVGFGLQIRKNLQKSLKFCKLSWTFEFLAKTFQILNEYDCFRVSKKRGKFKIWIKI
jgi:hypothetical protein